MLKHASLFSGIGGFDLAAEWAGWENIFHCEWNEFGNKILNYYWPNAISYEDITKTDFSIHRGEIDVLTGGFPCQPYSAAGKRKGKEDERHLWPEMLRAIREIKPTYVVGENVLGLVNWSGGLVFEEVQSDLEAEGYEVQPYILPAAAVGAPHRRDRVWFVAYSNERNDRRKAGEDESKGGKERIQQRDEIRESVKSSEVFGNTPDPNERTKGPSRTSGETESNRSKNNDEQGSRREPTKQHIRRGDVLRNAPDTESARSEGQRIKGQGQVQFERRSFKDARTRWSEFPTKPPVCGRNDGLPRELDSLTFPKWRNESIKAYGNAIVPQVAYQIFKAINQYQQRL